MSEKDETTFALNQDDTGTKTVFETPWFSVEKFPTVLPGKGVVEPDYRIVQPDTVMGIVLTEDEQLVVIKQFRRCCQTNANSSQFAENLSNSCSTKLLPLKKSSFALNLIWLSRF